MGDPFSATVVDRGDYQKARVYGHITEIDPSGKLTGRTSLMLGFDRLVMPDGRRAPIQAEIVEPYHAPSGERVGVEGAIESGGRGRKSIEHTAIGAGAGALLGGIFGGERAQESARSSAARAAWERPPFTAVKRSRSAAARKC